MIRYLIWDVDGTLLDTYPAIVGAFCAALGELGHPAASERVADLAGISISHCAAVFAAECRLQAEDLLQRFSDRYRAIPLEGQGPFPGAGAVCQYIRSIGGLNVIVTHRRRASLLKLLAAHNLAAHFVDMISADDGYPRKPDPAAFTAIMGRHGLEPEETLAIGDRDIDILAGRAAGTRTCLFGPAPGRVAADHAVAGYAELHRLLLVENGANRDELFPL